jgi:hypothetical protein
LSRSIGFSVLESSSNKRDMSLFYGFIFRITLIVLRPKISFLVCPWQNFEYISVSHRFVVLVWVSTTKLTFAAAGTSSTTLINNNAGNYGDFEPARLTGSQGAFTTVSALLAGKFSTILGTPMAGTYFYVRFQLFVMF